MRKVIKFLLMLTACLSVVLLFTITCYAASNFKVDCGGSGGDGLIADTGFNGGYTLSSGSSISPDFGYPNTIKSIRYGSSFYYQFNVEPGTYNIKLYFAEQYMSAVGQRKFDVKVNGNYVLRGYDIYAQAGGQNKGVEVEIKYIKCTDGILKIDFIGVVDTALVNNIVVYAHNYTVNCGGDAMGFECADKAYTAGSWGYSGTTNTAAGSAASITKNFGYPDGFKTVRYGSSFSYKFDVPNDSKYTVKLFFSEMFFNAANQRKFNVSIEGVSKLSAYDIFADAGGKDIGVCKVFDDITCSDGTLNVDFTSVVDKACINVIQVEKDSTPPSPITMTWSAVPTAIGDTSVSMTATAATDISGVEYLFENITVTGHNSGWQSSSSYTDTGLDPSTKYLYRISARDKSLNKNQNLWSIVKEVYTTGAKAKNGYPYNGQKIVAPVITLNWIAGSGASSHNIYFGTAYDSVNNATMASGEYKGNQTGTSYAISSPLLANQTYYWRIDEVGGSTVKGDVWNFTYKPWDGNEFSQWGYDALNVIERDLRIQGYNNYCVDSDKAAWSYQWGNAVELWAQAYAARLKPDMYNQLTSNLFGGMDYYWDTVTNGRSGYQCHTVTATPDYYARFYDDNSWTALALLEAYKATNNTAYLNRAKACIDFDLSGEDSTLGGGIWWKEGWNEGEPQKCKAVVASTSTALASAIYYQLTGTTSYRDAAVRLMNWSMSNFQDSSDKLIWDAIYDDSRMDYTKWSYNSAFAISALVKLYQITGVSSYLGQAQEIAAQAEKRWINPDGSVNDPVYFGLVLINSFIDLYEADWNYHWLNLGSAAARKLNENRDLAGHYSEQWSINNSSNTMPYYNILWDSCAAASFLKCATLQCFTLSTPTAIPAANITATAANTGWGSPNYTKDGSGLSNMGHSINYADMWTGSIIGGGTSPVPGTIPNGMNWLKYDFNSAYKLGTMYLWNDNQGGYTSRGMRDISIYYNNGNNWIKLGDYTVTRAPGTVNMPCNLTVEFNGVSATSVVILAKSVNGNWGDSSYLGVSEVRFGQFNTTANDTDNYVRYGLGWTYQDGRSSGDYNSDVHYCMQNGSYFEFTFTGTNVSYIGPKNVDYGTVDVYIDGVYMTTVDCSSPSYQAQQVLYSIAGLTNGTHVLKGVKTGGTYLCTDKFVAN